MIRQFQGQTSNTRGRTTISTVQNDTQEVFVARTPTDGIPAVVVNDDGRLDRPQAAPCKFYRRNTINGLDVLVSLKDATKPVYNLSTSDIPGDTWILAIRDKSGTWFTNGVTRPTEIDFGVQHVTWSGDVIDYDLPDGKNFLVVDLTADATLKSIKNGYEGRPLGIVNKSEDYTLTLEHDSLDAGFTTYRMVLPGAEDYILENPYRGISFFYDDTDDKWYPLDVDVAVEQVDTGGNGIDVGLTRTNIETVTLKSPAATFLDSTVAFDVAVGDMVVVQTVMLHTANPGFGTPTSVVVDLKPSNLSLPSEQFMQTAANTYPHLLISNRYWGYGFGSPSPSSQSETPLTNQTIRVFLTNPATGQPIAIAVNVFKLRGTIVSFFSHTTGSSTPTTGTGTSGSRFQLAHGYAKFLTFGLLATQGPVEDIAPTWGHSYIQDIRVGTTGGTATDNVTLTQVSKLNTTTVPRALNFSGMTSRKWLLHGIDIGPGG